jgi:hypothetical protein
MIDKKVYLDKKGRDGMVMQSYVEIKMNYCYDT